MRLTENELQDRCTADDCILYSNEQCPFMLFDIEHDTDLVVETLIRQHPDDYILCLIECANDTVDWWIDKLIVTDKNCSKFAKHLYEQFHSWWNVSLLQFPKIYPYLASHCHEYFDDWWKPELFCELSKVYGDWFFERLENECVHHKSKWLNEYIIWRSMNE